jgi:hypothetical protein
MKTKPTHGVRLGAIKAAVCPVLKSVSVQAL